MKAFKPCIGKTACTEGGSHCLACGRSHDEIARSRQLLDALTSLVLEMEYDNPAEFASYIARKLEKKVAYARNKQGDLV